MFILFLAVPDTVRTGCADTFAQCSMVTERLCKYEYYRTICCHSCKAVLLTWSYSQADGWTNMWS